MRWLEEDGHLSVFRTPSNYSNGNTRDREGRLVTCEHDARRVTRTEHDGNITVLLDRYENKPLNAPNDVVVASDGAVWFTDPGYGIDGLMKATRRRPSCHQRVPAGPATGAPRWSPATSCAPTGCAFRPTNLCSTSSIAGVAWRPGAYPGFPGRWRQVEQRPRVRRLQAGMTDGIRCDVDGNLWCSMGWSDPAEDGVRCYAPNGDLIGKIHLPEACANLCFAAARRTGCSCAPARRFMRCM